MPTRFVLASEVGDLKATLRELANGEVALIVEDSKYTTALSYTEGNAIFIGDALPGSSKASAIWRIKKLTYDSDDNVTDIQWAGGVNTFAAIWNDRVSLSYS